MPSTRAYKTGAIISGATTDGTTIVADSAAATGLRWQANGAGGKNAVINGGFDIWQRGTSFTATNVYTPDRWFAGSASARTLSRQTTSDTTNLPFIQYCARLQRNSGSSSTTVIDIGSPIETANTISYAGRAITFSYYARAGSNYSGTSSLLGVRLYTGTGTDQNAFTGYTGEAKPIDTTVTLTTTWQRFQHTITLGSTVTEMMPYFYYNPVGTASTNDYFEVTGVQIELGSVATAFTRTGGTLQGELAACQRYYYRQSGGDTYGCFATGAARSTTVIYAFMPLPVTMRVAPTSMDLSTISVEDYSGTTWNSGTFTLESGSQQKNMAWIRYTHGSAVFTQYRPAFLSVVNSSSAYIGFSAEL